MASSFLFIHPHRARIVGMICRAGGVALPAEALADGAALTCRNHCGKCPREVGEVGLYSVYSRPKVYCYQGLVNVPIEHHPTIADIQNPQKGTFTNPWLF